MQKYGCLLSIQMLVFFLHALLTMHGHRNIKYTKMSRLFRVYTEEVRGGGGGEGEKGGLST